MPQPCEPLLGGSAECCRSPVVRRGAGAQARSALASVVKIMIATPLEAHLVDHVADALPSVECSSIPGCCRRCAIPATIAESPASRGMPRRGTLERDAGRSRSPLRHPGRCRAGPGRDGPTRAGVALDSSTPRARARPFARRSSRRRTYGESRSPPPPPSTAECWLNSPSMDCSRCAKTHSGSNASAARAAGTISRWMNSTARRSRSSVWRDRSCGCAARASFRHARHRGRADFQAAAGRR